MNVSSSTCLKSQDAKKKKNKLTELKATRYPGYGVFCTWLKKHTCIWTRNAGFMWLFPRNCVFMSKSRAFMASHPRCASYVTPLEIPLQRVELTGTFFFFFLSYSCGKTACSVWWVYPYFDTFASGISAISLNLPTTTCREWVRKYQSNSKEAAKSVRLVN